MLDSLYSVTWCGLRIYTSLHITLLYLLNRQRRMQCWEKCESMKTRSDFDNRESVWGRRGCGGGQEEVWRGMCWADRQQDVASLTAPSLSPIGRHVVVLTRENTQSCSHRLTANALPGTVVASSAGAEPFRWTAAWRQRELSDCRSAGWSKHNWLRRWRWMTAIRTLSLISPFWQRRCFSGLPDKTKGPAGTWRRQRRGFKKRDEITIETERKQRDGRWWSCGREMVKCGFLFPMAEDIDKRLKNAEHDEVVCVGGLCCVRACACA